MESPALAHWKAKAVCAACGRNLDRFPLFYCPQKHPCCQDCFKEFRLFSKGYESQMTCSVCKIIKGNPMASEANQECCSPRGIEPDIGRSYRGHPSSPTADCKLENYQDSSKKKPKTEEELFLEQIGISKEQFHKLQENYDQDSDRKSRPYQPKSKFTMPPSTSKKPFRCPHTPCNRTVALAQFVNHFKSEHLDIQSVAVERGKELLLPCDVSLIQNNAHLCLAMITVYEINRVDYLKPGSSVSIVRTCSRFCQKVPISTFWLMVTGTKDRRFSSAYCIFWLFTNSEETHKCTIEISSKDDSVSLSTLSTVSNALSYDFAKMRSRLQCLVVTKSSLRSLLKEGVALNLRITVH